MSEGRKVRFIIRYVDGTKHKFEYIQEEDRLDTASRIQQALSANQVLLDLGDRILIVPFQNIKSIEISPPPAKLPGTAVRGVQLVE